MFSFFKELLWDTPVDMMRDGIFSAVFGFMMFISIWSILLFLCFGVFYLIDSVGVEPYQSPAQVVSKKFTPAHTTTTTVIIDNVARPQIINHPDDWDITVKLPQQVTVTCDATQTQYNQLNPGEEAKVLLKTGRISSDIYCEKII